jgi:hypothetical protein
VPKAPQHESLTWIGEAGGELVAARVSVRFFEEAVAVDDHPRDSAGGNQAAVVAGRAG